MKRLMLFALITFPFCSALRLANGNNIYVEIASGLLFITAYFFVDYYEKKKSKLDTPPTKKTGYDDIDDHLNKLFLFLTKMFKKHKIKSVIIVTVSYCLMFLVDMNSLYCQIICYTIIACGLISFFYGIQKNKTQSYE